MYYCEDDFIFDISKDDEIDLTCVVKYQYKYPNKGFAELDRWSVYYKDVDIKQVIKGVNKHLYDEIFEAVAERVSMEPEFRERFPEY